MSFLKFYAKLRLILKKLKPVKMGNFCCCYRSGSRKEDQREGDNSNLDEGGNFASTDLIGSVWQKEELLPFKIQGDETSYNNQSWEKNPKFETKSTTKFCQQLGMLCSSSESLDG